MNRRCGRDACRWTNILKYTHTQTGLYILKSIEYLQVLILILIARIGNHTHDYLSTKILSCNPSWHGSFECLAA